MCGARLLEGYVLLCAKIDKICNVCRVEGGGVGGVGGSVGVYGMATGSTYF